MALPMTVEQDVHDLRERVKYLEGWKDGEAERYGRLEGDVAGIKVEIRELRSEMGQLRSEMGQLRNEMGQLRSEMGQLRSEVYKEISQLRSEVNQRIEHLEVRFNTRFLQVDARLDRLMWFMMATLGGVLAQLAVTVLLR